MKAWGAQLGGDLQADPLVAWINVVQMDGGRHRAAPARVGQRSGPAAATCPAPVEVLQGGGFLHQGLDEPRVKWVALAQRLGPIIVLPHGRTYPHLDRGVSI
ncbi:MAG: hypothetical protein OXH01_07780 [Bacteroidetes bacterium]|nr:hypothetical protein [Bacteroidota bacterium]